VRTRTLHDSCVVRAAVRAGHAGLGLVPIAVMAARAQVDSGGAVYMSQGTLVFDGAAISGTRAVVRPLGPAHDIRGGGGRPAADRVVCAE
jgi:hypothetical protein